MTSWHDIFGGLIMQTPEGSKEREVDLEHTPNNPNPLTKCFVIAVLKFA